MVQKGRGIYSIDRLRSSVVPAPVHGVCMPMKYLGEFFVLPCAYVLSCVS